jgi:multiple sugar transport system substrate-binding protein
MKRPPRRALTGIALAAAALVLAGCAGTAKPASSAAPVRSVTIMSGQQSQNGALLTSMFQDYSAKSKTSVTLQMNNDSDLQTAQKALLDISAGHAPDAVRVTSATYQTLIDSGAAQPVDTCLKSDPTLYKQLNASVLSGLKVKGKIYEVPWYVTPNALFYNADLFRKAGLDPDAPPATFSEFEQDAQKIAALPGNPGGGVTYFGNDYNFQGYVASLGGTVYDPATKKVGVDTAQGKQVFDSFHEMVASGASPVYSDFFTDANGAFAGGKLGMIVTSTSGYPQLAATGGFDLRIAAAPHPDGGKALAVSSTNGFVITTKDPARQKAVCDALLSTLSPAAVTKTVSATVTIPLNTAAVHDQKYLAPVFAKNPDWAKALDQKLLPWVSLPGKVSNEYSTDYLNEQTKVLNGSESGAQAAATLQKATEQLVGQ